MILCEIPKELLPPGSFRADSGNTIFESASSPALFLFNGLGESEGVKGASPTALPRQIRSHRGRYQRARDRLQALVRQPGLCQRRRRQAGGRLWHHLRLAGGRLDRRPVGHQPIHSRTERAAMDQPGAGHLCAVALQPVPAATGLEPAGRPNRALFLFGAMVRRRLPAGSAFRLFSRLPADPFHHPL